MNPPERKRVILYVETFELYGIPRVFGAKNF